jgi:hypothetical protein
MIANTIKEYKDKNKKLTIILGSGFHRQGLGNNSILSNWEILLSKLSNCNFSSKNYTLDFEQIIINQTNNQDLLNGKQAHLIEKKRIKTYFKIY